MSRCGKQVIAVVAAALMLLAAMEGVTAEPRGARATMDRLEAELGRNPFDPVTLNNLAVMRAEQGNYHAAADLLERARRLSPANEAIRRNHEAVEAWIAEHGRRVVTLPRDGRQPARRELPPEPPPLWN